MKKVFILLITFLAIVFVLNVFFYSDTQAATVCSFTNSLYFGVNSDDVLCLQKYLNSAGFAVAASGTGSPGSETTFYGSLTRTAIAKWQAANNVSPAAGYFGVISRAKFNELNQVATGASLLEPPESPVGTNPPAPTAKITAGSTIGKPQPVGDKLIGPWNVPDLHCAPYDLVAVSQSDANVIYITSSFSENNCGVYKSNDGGETFWAANGSGDFKLRGFPNGKYYLPITAISIAPNNSDLIYVGTSRADNGSIFKSIDGGKNWTNISGERALGWFGREISGQIDSIAIDPKDSNTVYIGLSENIAAGPVGKIYKTSNGGTDWGEIKSGRVNDAFFIAIDPKNTNTIYTYTKNFTRGKLNIGGLGDIPYTGISSGLYKSINQGNTWKSLIVGDSSPTIGDLEIDPFDSSILYISTGRMEAIFIIPWCILGSSCGSPGIKKTTTGDEKWFPFNTQLLTTTIVADSAIPNVVYTATVNPLKIFYSVEGSEWLPLGMQNDVQLPSLISPLRLYINGPKRVLYAPTSDGIYIIKLEQVDKITPLPTLPASQTLSVSLSVSQSSVTAGQSVSLTANVSGTAQGTINYTFYCNRSDSGANIISGWNAKFNGVSDNPKTATNICNYSNPGTYTAKVITERGSASPAEAHISINVTSSLQPPIEIAPTPTCSFARDLYQSVRGNDVLCLQKYLNASGFNVASNGSGSPGNETDYFGPLMAKAVANWQTANSISPASGYFGTLSRAKFNVAPIPTPIVCVPNWQCNNWSICSGGQQTRTCTNSNNCGVSTGEPSQIQSCVTPNPTPVVSPPQIKSISPNSPPASNASQWVTINGTGFVSGLKIILRTGNEVYTIPVTSGFINSNQINITPNFTATPAPWTVQAVNPDGGQSNMFSFNVSASVTTPAPTPTPTLSVSISANPTSGSAPLNAVSLTAAVTGSAQGTINYTFYCNRSDSGTNITSGWDAKFDGVFDNPKIAVCNYQNAGTYTAKVIAERGSAPPAEARISINVTSSPIPACTPNWQCSGFGSCINGQQTQTCTDTNNCGVSTNVPVLTQSCTVSCIPNWQTGAWSTCVNGQQTRTVTDYNNCGTTTGKPSQTQSCATASPAPVITSLSPNPPLTQNASQWLTINGTGFVQGLKIVLRTGSEVYEIPITSGYVSSNQVRIYPNLTVQPALWTVQAINPDGGQSNMFGFSVTAVNTPAPQTLYVSLSANPSSITAGQNASLTADVSGTAQGTIHYQFDCTNNGSYEVDVVNNTDPYTTSLCSYPSSGTYTAKVHVERGTAWPPAEATVSITVNAATPVAPVVNLVLSLWPASGAKGTRFTFAGSGFNPGGVIQEIITKPDGARYAPNYLTANAQGSATKTYDSSTASIFGTYTIYWVDESTGKQSNTVYETISAY
ncbi:MAG: peptidoglycan-binding protein [Candidatus Levybacteria bacterium]|nr:peptidoglycan-binding protein [Candidatus Levybacteria bacterium]